MEEQRTKKQKLECEVLDTKQEYKDPPKNMPQEEVQKYADKIEIFKVFEPSILRIANTKDIEISPGVWEKHDKDKKYDLTEKIVFGQKNSLTDGYLYSMVTLPADKETEDHKLFRKEFEDKNMKSFKKIEIFGLHTYGGYWAFFRPDLTEVIHLLKDSIDISSVRKMFVTTEPHPSSNIGECFDTKKDKHKALTTCYVLDNPLIIPVSGDTPADVMPVSGDTPAGGPALVQ